jgi:two-component system CheB/CheR fusion protein
MKTPWSFSAWQVALLYLFIAGLWILLSDRVLAAFASSPADLTTWQTAKGWFFVAFTAALVYGERRFANRAFGANERMFRQITENIEGVFWLMDLPTREFLYLSRKYEDLWGRSSSGVLRQQSAFPDFVHPDDRTHVLECIAAQDRGIPLDEEFRIIRPDGEIRWVWARSFFVNDSEGRPTRVAGIAEDVTERHALEEGVRSSLREKEVLLKEIHHRVKNNLQIISSLLNLQLEHMQNAAAASTLRDSQSRIRTMALVHEKLYSSRDLARIDLRNYIEDLTAGLLHAHGRPQIRLTLDVEEVSLGIDAAIPLGLILNELVSNALKYAFPDGRTGTITITLRPEPGGILCLAVEDDGVGFPPEIDFRRTASLGLQLVNTLAEQIEAAVDLDTSPRGSRLTVRLPSHSEARR